MIARIACRGVARAVPIVCISRPSLQCANSGIVNARMFTGSAALYKKTKKTATHHSAHRTHDAVAEDSIAQPADELVNISEVESKFKRTLEAFSAKIKDLKTGSASLDKLGALNITLQHDEIQPLKSIAALQSRGNRVTVVVFEPRNVKYIQSAILSDLNISPQADPKNNQTLHVTFPAEEKGKLDKELKIWHDHFRNSPSKHSLTAIRGDAVNVLKKAKKGHSSDENSITRVQTHVESLFSKYSDELAALWKKAK